MVRGFTTKPSTNMTILTMCYYDIDKKSRRVAMVPSESFTRWNTENEIDSTGVRVAE